LLSLETGIPYLVTITGSDLFDLELRADQSTVKAIIDAAAVTCFDSLVARHLAEALPEVTDRITVIPQGVTPLTISEPFPHGYEEFIVLLPAAIRPVKGIKSAIEALTPLAETFPSLRLLIAGGDLDTVYADGIRDMVACLPWANMLGDVPHQLMGDLFASADLVLNCSLFEGGMANTLLEAMIMGRPILARDILGNRSLIRHGETGWLYDNDQELQEMVRMILHNPKLGTEIGEAGRYFVQECCSTSKEAERYLEVYGQVLT
jgi:glycosyltransferase involved in cell wall biosynthesis